MTPTDIENKLINYYSNISQSQMKQIIESGEFKNIIKENTLQVFYPGVWKILSETYNFNNIQKSINSVTGRVIGSDEDAHVEFDYNQTLTTDVLSKSIIYPNDPESYFDSLPEFSDYEYSISWFEKPLKMECKIIRDNCISYSGVNNTITNILPKYTEVKTITTTFKDFVIDPLNIDNTMRINSQLDLINPIEIFLFDKFINDMVKWVYTYIINYGKLTIESTVISTVTWADTSQTYSESSDPVTTTLLEVQV